MKNTRSRTGVSFGGLSRLRTFLFLWTPVVIIVLSLLWGWQFYEARNQKNFLVQDSRRILRLVKEIAARDLYLALTDLASLAENPSLQAFAPEELSGNTGDINRYLQSLAATKQTYSHIRLLSTTGQELIRVDHKNDATVVAPRHQLRFNNRFQYFRQGIKLARNQIYVSRFDLNIEQDELERPYNPTIRFAAPVYGPDEHKSGVLVLHYNGGEILRQLAAASNNLPGRIFLVDEEGYWLLGPTTDDEWGFMFKEKQDRTIQRTFPQAGKSIKGQDSGQILNDQGLFTFARVSLAKAEVPRILGDTIINAYVPDQFNEATWTLVYYLPPETLAALAGIKYPRRLFESAAWAGILAVLCWYSALAIVAKRRHQHDIQRKNAELETILRSTPEAIIFTDPNRRIVMINQAFTSLFGYDSAEIAGLSPRIYYDNPADYEKQGRLRYNLEAGVNTEPYEITYRRKNGSLFLGETVGTIVKNAAGHTFGFFVVIRDVTETRRMQKALAESENRLRLLIDSMVDHVLTMDTEGSLTAYYHAEAIHLLCPPEQAIGKSYRDVLAPELAGHLESALTSCAESCRSQEFDFTLGKGHDARWFSAVLNLLRDEAGSNMGYLVSIREVTERVAMARKLLWSESSLAKAQEVARMGNWEWNPNTNELEMSSALCKLLDIPPERYRSDFEGFWGMVHPEDQTAFRQAVDAAIFKGEKFDLEHRIVKAGGEILWFHAQNEYTFNEAGEITRIIGTVLDITNRKQAELRILENENRIRAIVDTAVDGIISINEEGVIESFNLAAERMFGYEASETVGRKVNILMPPPHREEHDEYIRRYLKTGLSRIIGRGREVAGRRKDGSLFPADLAVSEFRLGGKRYFTGTVRDITERKRYEEELRIKETAIQSSIDAICMTDLDGRLTYVNQAWLTLWGYASEKEIIGRSIEDFWEEKEKVLATRREADDKGNSLIEMKGVKKDRETFFALVSTSVVTDSQGKAVLLMRSVVDISEQKKAEEQLRRQALYDVLTNLFNRRHLMDTLEAAVKGARRHGFPLTVCMCDLDHFKKVNDTYGHKAGDEVLAGFGKLIAQEIRAEDFAGRYGGEEFVAGLPYTPVAEARNVIERIRVQLAEQKFTGPEGQEFGITASFGLAQLPDTPVTVAELLDLADRALYKAKQSGRNRVVISEA